MNKNCIWSIRTIVKYINPFKKRIYDPVNENCIWIISYYTEIYRLFDETEIVKAIKTSRMRWNVG